MMMPAMRHNAPMTPRAKRPWRSRLGLKNRLTRKTYHGARRKPRVACAAARVHICSNGRHTLEQAGPIRRAERTLHLGIVSLGNDCGRLSALRLEAKDVH